MKPAGVVWIRAAGSGGTILTITLGMAVAFHSWGGFPVVVFALLPLSLGLAMIDRNVPAWAPSIALVATLINEVAINKIWHAHLNLKDLWWRYGSLEDATVFGIFVGLACLKRGRLRKLEAAAYRASSFPIAFAIVTGVNAPDPVSLTFVIVIAIGVAGVLYAVLPTLRAQPANE